MSDQKSLRISEIINPHWINYPASVEIMSQLKQLLEFPRTHRPQSLLILSETNNGKTILARRFVSAQKPLYKINEEGYEKIVLEVVMIQCPHVFDEKRLYLNILDKLNVAYRSSVRPQELQAMIINVFRQLEVKILILDEIQHGFNNSSAVKQREFLNLLKYLSNELELCIVGVGTWEAFYAINSDSQLANRFNKAVLPKWKFDNNFISLLATYQSFIKLEKPFTLLEPKIASKIFELGEGLLGEYIDILKKCAHYAIHSGEETITIETLDKIDYTRPSMKRDDSILTQ